MSLSDECAPASAPAALDQGLLARLGSGESFSSAGDADPTESEAAEPSETPVSMAPLYMITLAMPVDEGLVLPSLYAYIQTLNGGSRAYGAVLVSYYMGRVIFVPLVGLWVERAPYRRVFLSLLWLGVLASLLYFLAPALGGVWVVGLSRFLLGVSSTLGVAVLTFVGENIPPSERRSAMARTFGFQRAFTPIAPLANLLLVRLPSWRVGSVRFDQYTLAGLLIALVNAASIFVALCTFREPARAARPADVRAPRCAEVCRTVGRSGAYVSYFLSAQNNWVNQCFLWSLPLITAELYPSLKVLGNSLLLSVGGFAGLITAFSVPYLCNRLSDRMSILLVQCFQGLVVLAMTFSYGGCVGGDGYRPPLALLYFLFCAYNVGLLAQMPANNAIYMKLVGSGNPGLYQSLLELSKAVPRVFASFLIGEAYESLGSCWLWGLTLSVWALQFVPFLANWRRLAV